MDLSPTPDEATDPMTEGSLDDPEDIEGEEPETLTPEEGEGDPGPL